jgi:hypothetical protein
VKRGRTTKNSSSSSSSVTEQDQDDRHEDHDEETDGHDDQVEEGEQVKIPKRQKITKNTDPNSIVNIREGDQLEGEARRKSIVAQPSLKNDDKPVTRKELQVFLDNISSSIKHHNNKPIVDTTETQTSNTFKTELRELSEQVDRLEEKLTGRLEDKFKEIDATFAELKSGLQAGAQQSFSASSIAKGAEVEIQWTNDRICLLIEKMEEIEAICNRFSADPTHNFRGRHTTHRQRRSMSI